MKINIKSSLLTMLAIPLAALSVGGVMNMPVSAVECDSNSAKTAGLNGSAECSKSSSQPNELFGDNGMFRIITNVLLFIIGAVSVIMLVIGGIRYTIFQGDQSAVTSAKNTILYAIIGIIVAILAYAIVNFVIGSLAANGQQA